jgi:hypothetical protein
MATSSWDVQVQLRRFIVPRFRAEFSAQIKIGEGWNSVNIGLA